MTLSTTASSVTYQGNGATTSFPFSFLVPSAADLVVSLTDTTQSPAVLTTLGSSQFTVSGFGNSNGGAVIYPVSGTPLPVGISVSLRRVVAYVQNTSIVNQGGFYPDVIEAALDMLTMQAQQLAEGLSRAVQVPVGSGIDPNSYLATAQSAATGASNSASAASAALAQTQAAQATVATDLAAVQQDSVTVANLMATIILPPGTPLSGGDFTTPPPTGAVVGVTFGAVSAGNGGTF